MNKKLVLMSAITSMLVMSTFALASFTNLGFTANGVAMPTHLDGYSLTTDGNGATNYEIKFDGSTTTDLTDGTYNLYLTGIVGQTPTSLKNYYDASGIPDPYLTYLKDATDETNPFAIISVASTVPTLYDATKKYFNPSSTVGMTVPGNYPCGKYTVSTKSPDPEVTFVLYIQGSQCKCWDVSGSWVFLGYDVTLSQNGNTLSGSGGYPSGGPYQYAWAITSGSVIGDTIDFYADYTLGSDALTPLTTMHVVGIINPADGTMSGTWSDNYQDGTRTGTWASTVGNAVGALAPLADKQKGVCAGSLKVCAGISWIEPDYTKLPYYENPEVSCDGKDNNCDGQVDTHVCDWFCTPTANDMTTMTKLVLGTNRWIYNPSASTTNFVTVPPKGKGWLKGYALTATNGCSCSQILTQLNKYNPTLYGDMSGQWKYGCSISVMDDFIRLIDPAKTFTATDSVYNNGPLSTDPLYATGPISFTWYSNSGTVTGGYYDETNPPSVGTLYHNNINSGIVSGSTVNLNFDRGSYTFTFAGSLTGTYTLTGQLAGPYLFTATGTVTP